MPVLLHVASCKSEQKSEVKMRQFILVLMTVIFTMVLCNAKVCRADTGLSAVEEISYAVASWYGADFHGKKTASGQTFDMNNFTCAHKKYPFGSWLKITNVLNEKTTFCVVNDRGPFKAWRELDLSYAAAKVLDMITLGQCMVKIEFLGVDNEYIQAVKGMFRKDKRS
jgi:rare lipoprotein A